MFIKMISISTTLCFSLIWLFISSSNQHEWDIKKFELPLIYLKFPLLLETIPVIELRSWFGTLLIWWLVDWAIDSQINKSRNSMGMGGRLGIMMFFLCLTIIEFSQKSDRWGI